jgi:hypothetical protein
MIDLQLDIPSEVLAEVLIALKNQMEDFAEELPLKRPPAPGEPETPDADLEEVIEADLRHRLSVDCALLSTTLVELHDGAHRLQVDETTAEGLLRASSAIRLGLRRTSLRNIPDEALEGAPLLAHMIQQSQQEAFMVYCFLAALQSIIIEALDPEI